MLVSVHQPMSCASHQEVKKFALVTGIATVENVGSYVLFAKNIVFYIPNIEYRFKIFYMFK